MSAEDKANTTIKNNIDLWQPHIDRGIEAIMMSSSGCGVTLKEYKTHLQYDEKYKEKAEIVSNLVKDPIEILEPEIEKLKNLVQEQTSRLSFHAPCTLQHGLKVHTKVESLLTKLGYQLNVIKDSHLCCGSAGSYSIFHPKISTQLLSNKISALEENKPEIIATSNIGCLTHLNSQAKQPVKHWLSVIYENLKEK